MKVALYDTKGKEKKTFNVDEKIQNFKVNEKAIHDTVVMNLACKRKSVASTKTKGEVNYSGVKLWKQKGTGRARCHYRSAPHWRGGGVVFGPRTRDFSFLIPKKVKQLALKSALVKALRNNEVLVIEKMELAEPKTKLLVKMFAGLEVADNKVLLIGKENNRNIKLAVRNIPDCDFRTVDKIGTFDIVSHGKIVIEEEAFEELKKRY